MWRDSKRDVFRDSAHTFVVRETWRRARIEGCGRMESSCLAGKFGEKSLWCDRRAVGIDSFSLVTNDSKLEVDDAGRKGSLAVTGGVIVRDFDVVIFLEVDLD